MYYTFLEDIVTQTSNLKRIMLCCKVCQSLKAKIWMKKIKEKPTYTKKTLYEEA